jgi:hypothetical protein
MIINKRSYTPVRYTYRHKETGATGYSNDGRQVRPAREIPCVDGINKWILFLQKRMGYCVSCNNNMKYSGDGCEGASQSSV